MDNNVDRSSSHSILRGRVAVAKEKTVDVTIDACWLVCLWNEIQNFVIKNLRECLRLQAIMNIMKEKEAIL